MKKVKELIHDPQIQIALATGFSIIILAYVSKRVLSESMGYLPLAIPPFIATIYSATYNRHKDSHIFTTWFWIAAILAATLIVIIYYLV